MSTFMPINYIEGSRDFKDIDLSKVGVGSCFMTFDEVNMYDNGYYDGDDEGEGDINEHLIPVMNTVFNKIGCAVEINSLSMLQTLYKQDNDPANDIEFDTTATKRLVLIDNDKTLLVSCSEQDSKSNYNQSEFSHIRNQDLDFINKAKALYESNEDRKFYVTYNKTYNYCSLIELFQRFNGLILYFRSEVNAGMGDRRLYTGRAVHLIDLERNIEVNLGDMKKKYRYGSKEPEELLYWYDLLKHVQEFYGELTEEEDFMLNYDEDLDRARYHKFERAKRYWRQCYQHVEKIYGPIASRDGFEIYANNKKATLVRNGKETDIRYMREKDVEGMSEEIFKIAKIFQLAYSSGRSNSYVDPFDGRVRKSGGDLDYDYEQAFYEDTKGKWIKPKERHRSRAIEDHKEKTYNGEIFIEKIGDLWFLCDGEEIRKRYEVLKRLEQAG